METFRDSVFFLRIIKLFPEVHQWTLSCILLARISTMAHSLMIFLSRELGLPKQAYLSTSTPGVEDIRVWLRGERLILQQYSLSMWGEMDIAGKKQNHLGIWFSEVNVPSYQPPWTLISSRVTFEIGLTILMALFLLNVVWWHMIWFRNWVLAYFQSALGFFSNTEIHKQLSWLLIFP